MRWRTAGGGRVLTSPSGKRGYTKLVPVDVRAKAVAVYVKTEPNCDNDCATSPSRHERDFADASGADYVLLLDLFLLFSRKKRSSCINNTST